jgi:hypothetical protein
MPSCVHHCQALVMEYGPVEKLAAKINKPKMVCLYRKILENKRRNSYGTAKLINFLSGTTIAILSISLSAAAPVCPSSLSKHRNAFPGLTYNDVILIFGSIRLLWLLFFQ